MPDVVIVGDPHADPTGVMCERSFAARGFETVWVSASDFLEGKHPSSVRIGLFVSNEFPNLAVKFFELFDDLGLLTTNSARSVEMACNKVLSFETFTKFGIPTPATAVLETGTSVDDLGLSLPVVIKPIDGARGDGVMLIDRPGTDLQVLEPTIAQHYVECGSADKRLIFVDGQFVVAMERRAGADDFRSNLAKGGTAHSCEPTIADIALGKDIVDAMDLRFAGLDIGVVRQVLPDREYLEIGQPFCFEANAMPALDYPALIGGVDASVALVDMLISDLNK